MAHTLHRQLEEMVSLAISSLGWLPCTLYQVNIAITGLVYPRNYANLIQCILIWAPLISLNGLLPSSDSWPFCSQFRYTYFTGMDQLFEKNAPLHRPWLQTGRRRSAEFLSAVLEIRTQCSDICREVVATWAGDLAVNLAVKVALAEDR